MTGPVSGDAPRLPANAIRAYRVIVAGIALSVVETVVTVLDRGSLQRRILRDNPDTADVGWLVDIAMVSGLLAGAAAIALWIGLARTIRHGGNWSAVITPALVATVALLAGAALVNLASALDAMLSGAWGVLIIAVIVLLAIRLFAYRA